MIKLYGCIEIIFPLTHSILGMACFVGYSLFVMLERSNTCTCMHTCPPGRKPGRCGRRVPGRAGVHPLAVLEILTPRVRYAVTTFRMTFMCGD
jgi:hypothetical protein